MKMKLLAEDLISNGRVSQTESLTEEEVTGQGIFLRVVFEHFGCDVKHTEQIL